jgi:hypothetical protein
VKVVYVIFTVPFPLHAVVICVVLLRSAQFIFASSPTVSAQDKGQRATRRDLQFLGQQQKHFIQ